MWRSAYRLEFVVFMSAAIGMVLELAGSRLMSPYFGNSLFVWTSLIGVILAFMSLGNYLGGRLADRRGETSLLSWALGAGALGVAGVSLISQPLLAALSAEGASPLRSVAAACLLFSVPSTLLGMVTPYSTRVSIHGLGDAGATVGRLYALGTLGSIAGTFAAGFWLISVVGTRSLILVCAVTLIVLAALMLDRFEWRTVLMILFVLAVIAVAYIGGESDVVALDTQYDHYLVRSGGDPATGRPIIGLSRDYISAESASYADTGEPFPFEYYRFYDAAAQARNAKRALVVGGGTFSYPRLFLERYPSSSVDVVEIDAELLQVATDRFGYTPDDRMKLYFEDGRTFLNRAEGPYDAVFMDAFKSAATVPYQLTTVESWRRCYDVLDADGVLVMNVVASPSERSRFFNALVATISSVFPRVEVYSVPGDGRATLHNTSIVASKVPDQDVAADIASADPGLAAHRLESPTLVPGTRLLTDDFAPVDQYLMSF